MGVRGEEKRDEGASRDGRERRCRRVKEVESKQSNTNNLFGIKVQSATFFDL